MSTPLPTKEDFVNWVKKTLPQAVKAIGKHDLIGRSYLDLWVEGKYTLSVTYDKFFQFFQIEGGTQQLQNMILNWLNLKSVGFDSPDPKVILGQQYRNFLARANAVLQHSQQELQMLNDELKVTTDPSKQSILRAEIQEQQTTVNANSSNVQIWTTTLNAAITAGQAT